MSRCATQHVGRKWGKPSALVRPTPLASARHHGGGPRVLPSKCFAQGLEDALPFPPPLPPVEQVRVVARCVHGEEVCSGEARQTAALTRIDRVDQGRFVVKRRIRIRARSCCCFYGGRRRLTARPAASARRFPSGRGVMWCATTSGVARTRSALTCAPSSVQSAMVRGSEPVQSHSTASASWQLLSRTVQVDCGQRSWSCGLGPRHLSECVRRSCEIAGVASHRATSAAQHALLGLCRQV